MLKVAITGNIASGKSEIEKFLISMGFNVLDTDIVAHDLLKKENIKNQIICFFPNVLENDEISRQKLGQIVFADENSRKILENILHPLIKDEIGRFFCQQEKQGKKIAFVSVPLLFEAKFEGEFDKIILIYTDDNIRIKRLMERNHLPLEYAQNRLKIQISQDKKVSLVDYVIYNNSSLKDLRIELEKILKFL